MIFMEVKDNDEDNIYDFDSENPLDMDIYIDLVNKTKISIKNIYKILKNVIYRNFII